MKIQFTRDIWAARPERRRWAATACFFLMCCLGLVEADRAAADVSVSSDATPWFLSGFSLAVTVEPIEHWRFGAEVWGFDFPEALVELNKDNKGEGWRRRVDVALALYVDYGLNSDGSGWHFGLALDALRSTVSRSGVEGEGSFWSFEILPRVGYRWFVFRTFSEMTESQSGPTGFFLHPWVGAGPIFSLEQTPSLGGERFEESTLQFIGTAHLGWLF